MNILNLAEYMSSRMSLLALFSKNIFILSKTYLKENRERLLEINIFINSALILCIYCMIAFY